MGSHHAAVIMGSHQGVVEPQERGRLRETRGGCQRPPRRLLTTRDDDVYAAAEPGRRPVGAPMVCGACVCRRISFQFSGFSSSGYC